MSGDPARHPTSPWTDTHDTSRQGSEVRLPSAAASIPTMPSGRTRRERVAVLRDLDLASKAVARYIAELAAVDEAPERSPGVAPSGASVAASPQALHSSLPSKLDESFVNPRSSSVVHIGSFRSLRLSDIGRRYGTRTVGNARAAKPAALSTPNQSAIEPRVVAASPAEEELVPRVHAAPPPTTGAITAGVTSGVFTAEAEPSPTAVDMPEVDEKRKGPQGTSPKSLGLTEKHPLVAVADFAYVMSSVLILAAAVSGLTPSQSASIWAAVAVIVVAQLVTIAWTALRFFVQVRTGAWEIIAHIPDIRKHYRETWLAFDVVCALPLDLVLLAWGVAPFFWAQVRQMVRLVRIVHLTRSSNPLRENRLWLQFTVFLLLLLFSFHAAACVFQTLGDRSYIDALYWTASTMTSVGYGDVVPKETAGSRGYAIVVMFLGVGCVASVTAFTTAFLASKDALEAKSREKKQMLASMLEYYRIPWDQQIEIIGLFPTALDAENERNFTQLVQNMPAFIVERIEGYTRAKALSGSIPMFSELPVNIVLEMTSKLHHRFVQANDAIIEYGTEGHEMFFLVRGIADVVIPIGDGVDQVVVAVLRSGAFFGEMALLQHTTRSASVIAVVPCEVLVLSQVDFEHLTQQHVELERIFAEEVFARVGMNQQRVANPLGAADEGDSDDTCALSDGNESHDGDLVDRDNALRPSAGDDAGFSAV